ncbi:Y-family DNA polymerase [Thiomicrorhabdus arctica]|uniref:Y-family DNA polymerase n=1 Tax=Thiomicrorhabdus arctica TaxID=131540 RepID=UPI0003610EA5|nr:Y-family DNA polymerase [Thiomicrorhabdus arctica]
MKKYALVDGNSFYASCEIAFNPALKSRPVVVLSNNDGCIVAANHLAKQLDHYLKQPFERGGYHAAQKDSMMFQPYFKVARLLKKHNTAVFSSNYELYADMSQRMHAISAQFAPRQEIYSIDESFLDFSNLIKDDLTLYAQQLKQTVFQWIGIPVAVGIGASKTQAKLANHLAKKSSHCMDVLDLTCLSQERQDALYKTVKVGKVWGIGKQLSQKLESQNIVTAYDLKYSDPKTIRQQFSVNVERTLLELNGQACFPFHEHTLAKLSDNYAEKINEKKQIISSRSFGKLVEHFDDMRQAVASYTAVAAEKLRGQKGACQMITVYITTPPYRENVLQYQNQISLPLIYPSDSTVLLSKMSLRALKKIWKPGFQYLKASVSLSQINPKGAIQTDLFAPNPHYSGNQKSDALMLVMDQMNHRMGKGSLQLANSGLHQQSWKMNRNLMSPRCTTRWNELQTVKT